MNKCEDNIWDGHLWLVQLNPVRHWYNFCFIAVWTPATTTCGYKQPIAVTNFWMHSHSINSTGMPTLWTAGLMKRLVLLCLAYFAGYPVDIVLVTVLWVEYLSVVCYLANDCIDSANKKVHVPKFCFFWANQKWPKYQGIFSSRAIQKLCCLCLMCIVIICVDEEAWETP